LKVDTLEKLIINRKLNQSLGDDKLLLKKNLEFYLNCIKDKKMSITEAAIKLQCTRQWISKLYYRFCKGENLEKKRGHKKKALNKDIQNNLFELYKSLSYYQDETLFTPSMEVLKSIAIEQIPDFPDIHIQTIRDYLKLNKKYPKKIRSKKYRKRFEAKFVGEIIQGDVSTHQWIPESGIKFHLILFIDDKSRYVLYAKFIESDNLVNHITALKQLFLTFGLPIAIYYDNDSKYSYIRHGGIHFDQKTENPELTIPRALNEICVNLILSKPFQPQGKGKVERKFLTFQNQLPFYLKLKKASNIHDANQILDEYVIKHNSTFSRAIKSTPENIFKNSDDVFRDLKKKDIDNIENAFTKRYIRKVTKVNEISFNNNPYSVPKFNNFSLAEYEIEVRENPEEWIKLFYKDSLLTKYDLRSSL